MEASETMIRGNVDSLMKLITAFDKVGIEMIDEGATSTGQGRGVRLRGTLGFRNSPSGGGSLRARGKSLA
jgi:hypothetical protein